MIMMKDIGPKFFQRIRDDLEKQELGSLIAEKEHRGRPFWSTVYYIKEK